VKYEEIDPPLGETLMNKIGKKDSFKAQVVMLLAVSGMGLIIGLCIAYFV
jgi:hypothetical protein